MTKETIIYIVAVVVVNAVAAYFGTKHGIKDGMRR